VSRFGQYGVNKGFNHLIHGQVLAAHRQPLQLHNVVMRVLRVAQQRRVVQPRVCAGEQVY
jgi:hypothetical protein